MTTQSLRTSALLRAVDVSNLIQGEVLDVADACVVLAAAESPLSETASEVATELGADAGLIVVPQAVDQVVLLTQTCDLQETTERDYMSQLAPVGHVSEQVAREALRGRRPGLAGLPWLDSTAVADLSRITTAERAVIMGARSLGRPGSPKERYAFAEAVTRHLSRPALPNAVNQVLGPFVRRIAEKHDKNSPEGRCAHLLSELRLEASPDIDDEQPALNVLVVLEESELPSLSDTEDVDDQRIDALKAAGMTVAAEAVFAAQSPVTKREAWTALAECWIQPSIEKQADVPGVGSVGVSVVNGEELSYARSLNAPMLDVRYLSTRVA